MRGLLLGALEPWTKLRSSIFATAHALDAPTADAQLGGSQVLLSKSKVIGPRSGPSSVVTQPWSLHNQLGVYGVVGTLIWLLPTLRGHWLPVCSTSPHASFFPILLPVLAWPSPPPLSVGLPVQRVPQAVSGEREPRDDLQLYDAADPI